MDWLLYLAGLYATEDHGSVAHGHGAMTLASIPRLEHQDKEYPSSGSCQRSEERGEGLPLKADERTYDSGGRKEACGSQLLPDEQLFTRRLVVQVGKILVKIMAGEEVHFAGVHGCRIGSSSGEQNQKSNESAISAGAERPDSIDLETNPFTS